MTKDDVLTISLNGSNLILTRYLYLKDEVKLSLLMAILNKSDDAIFWAYELFYSGFKHELFQFIWIMYYDFFATLNPSFEAYLIKKQTEYLSKSFEERHISSLIQNLIIRPFNTDVFMMRKMCELFETESCSFNDTEEIKCKLKEWIETCDYRSIAYFILSNDSDKNRKISNREIYEYVLFVFEETGLKLLKTQLLKEYSNTSKITVNPAIILLTKIMALFSKQKQLIKGRNFYVKVFPEEVVQYETIIATNGIKAYRILRNACVCSIDEHKWLQLFALERNNVGSKSGKVKDVINKNIHNENWLYHASFSPIWFDRIKLHKGYIDYVNCVVHFTDSELEEAFYSIYDYEPDEQPLFVKIRTKMIEDSQEERRKTWKQFYEKYRNTGFIEIDCDELDALDEEPIKYN
jgi:hypothetical protein